MDLIDQSEPAYAGPQRQVQRWLGRCMLSLQQSERLLKALLHHSDVTAIHSGRGGEGAAAFEVNRAFEKKQLASMTLGSLVTAFFDGVSSDGEIPAGKRKQPDLPDDRFSIRTRFQWSMPPRNLEALQSSMREMVLLRNEWVHHLVDRFDLTSLDGCVQALGNLQAGYDKAERFRIELQGVAKAWAEASESMAAFYASPQGSALLLGGKVPLEATPLLNALRDAVQGSATVGDVAGAVLFSEVLEKLHSLHPNEKPENYGYASWPQVIHESGVFGMVRRDPEGRKTSPLVRLKASPHQGG